MTAASLDDASENYGAAVHTLATGIGGIRERLLDAYHGAAMHGHPPGPEIDADTARRIDTLHHRLTATHALIDEDAIAASVNALTPHEAVECAEEIVAIDDELRAQRADRDSRET
jgi:hypothetical protein